MAECYHFRRSADKMRKGGPWVMSVSSKLKREARPVLELDSSAQVP